MAKKILAQVIMSDSPIARERQRLGQQHLREVRIVSSKYNHHSSFIIWNDKIAMFSFKKEMMALVIESKLLAQTQRASFYMIWDMLKK